MIEYISIIYYSYIPMKKRKLMKVEILWWEPIDLDIFIKELQTEKFFIQMNFKDKLKNFNVISTKIQLKDHKET